jgi:lipoate---protein ligase
VAEISPSVLTSDLSSEAARQTGEWLLEPGSPPLHLWIPQQYAIVLGASQDLEREVDIERWQGNKLPIYRRRGGGGAVLLGPHCLCLALRLRRMPGWGPLDYFREIHQKLIVILNNVTNFANVTSESSPKNTLRIETKGISDLAVGEKKLAGTSLYLSRDRSLYLASILVTPDTSGNMTLLKHPSREPDYRQGRNHGEFLISLFEVGMRISTLELSSKIEVGWFQDLQTYLDIQP